MKERRKKGADRGGKKRGKKRRKERRTRKAKIERCQRPRCKEVRKQGVAKNQGTIRYKEYEVDHANFTKRNKTNRTYGVNPANFER